MEEAFLTRKMLALPVAEPAEGRCWPARKESEDGGFSRPPQGDQAMGKTRTRQGDKGHGRPLTSKKDPFTRFWQLFNRGITDRQEALGIPPPFVKRRWSLRQSKCRRISQGRRYNPPKQKSWFCGPTRKSIGARRTTETSRPSGNWTFTQAITGYVRSPGSHEELSERIDRCNAASAKGGEEMHAKLTIGLFWINPQELSSVLTRRRRVLERSMESAQGRSISEATSSGWRRPKSLGKKDFVRRCHTKRTGRRGRRSATRTEEVLDVRAWYEGHSRWASF